MGKLAPIQIDIHLERGNLHALPQIVGRSNRLHAAAAGGQTGDVLGAAQVLAEIAVLAAIAATDQ